MEIVDFCWFPNRTDWESLISVGFGRPEPARLGKSGKSQSRAGPAQDFGKFLKIFEEFRGFWEDFGPASSPNP